MSVPAAIELEGLCKSFGRVEIIRDVNLAIANGAIDRQDISEKGSYSGVLVVLFCCLPVCVKSTFFIKGEVGSEVGSQISQI